jgi:hypothetical protein
MLFSVFQWCFEKLVESEAITAFKSDLAYLIALDGTGTGYFSSDTIHCKNCLTKADKIRLETQPTSEQKEAAKEAIEAARKMEEAKKQGNTEEASRQAEIVVKKSEEYLKEELKKKPKTEGQ